VAQLAERLLGKEQVEGSNPSRGWTFGLAGTPGAAMARAEREGAKSFGTLGGRGAMTKARDPICGMSVDVERAPARGVYGGEPVYFCCAACQRRYEATHRPD
jgi:YHS domain-containing protein